MFKIAVFASGSGTNAENLIRHFNYELKGQTARVELVVCNKPEAYVLKRAENLKVPSVVMNKSQLTLTDNQIHPDVIGILKEYGIDFIVLAGYLLQIPKELIALYPDRIINIHPALLPNYGGQGMYGERVHKAVLEDMRRYKTDNPASSKDFYSGITIHLVDEEMDHGKILFQSSFILSPDETLESLEKKIHIREQADYPRVVEAYLNTL
ncbi:MAG: phosphoribosylglycinamide formyltransferase [Bacteroidales bacterium]|nr:phosphoribosylglycinamide formyltransferase [Bacteroidales bacterium]